MTVQPALPIRILLLEDDRNDAELVRRELTRGGVDCAMTHVSNEHSFRDAVTSVSFDAILADYNLPGFSGMTALEIARDVVPDTPFLFVSGSIGEERAIDALRNGATDYILKDRASRLPSAVVRALAERDERSLRSEAEEALRISQERFLVVARATRDVIWDWTLSEPAIWVNEALRTEWGFVGDPSEVTLEWWYAHIHPSEADQVIRHFKDTIASRDSRWQSSYRFRRGDGSYGYVFDRGMILRNESGAAVRIIGAMQDVSARVETERQLEQERRISGLGRVAATIAHEFNNVLMGIEPFAEVIRRRSAGDDGMARAADQISVSVRRGRRVTEEILRFTKPMKPVIQTIDLAWWLVALEQELRALAGDRITITWRLPDTRIPVACDSSQLQQVVTNLIMNSRDAISGKGTITIELMAALPGQAPAKSLALQGKKLAHLVVRDSGSGIPAELIETIFEPLFTTKPTGTGIGLGVVRQIVIQHGGEVYAENEPVRGAAFHVLLPLAADWTDHMEPMVVPATVAKRALSRILIVDDEAMIATGLAAILNLEGIEVELAYKGSDAVPAIERFKPDAVLLDLTLPDMNGIVVFKRIEERWPNLPVLFSTGHGSQCDLEIALAHRHVGFLQKPYQIEELLAELARLMSHCQ